MITTVGAVVVNYNGGSFVVECVRTLMATSWAGQLEIVVVDNASTDGSAEALEAVGATVVRSARNGGFGAGCNLGMAQLASCSAIALVNSDAFVDSGWLAPLVAVLDQDESVGVAVPLTVFAGPWQQVEVSSPIFAPGGADGRELGIQVFEPAGFTISGRNLHQPEAGFRWTSAGVTTINLPVDVGALEIICPNGAVVDGQNLEGSPHRQTVTLNNDPRVALIDNAGVRLQPDWWTEELHQWRPLHEITLAAGPVELWSGGAALLRREFLDDVGMFDEKMFLYFEDVELAVRGRRSGWRYAIEPASVVRHGHGWSTGGESNPLVRYCVTRNRLVVIARHAPIRTVATEWGRHFAAIGRAVRKRDRPEVAMLVRACAGALRAVARGPRPKWQKRERPGRYHPGRS
jgi:N-acetylglucosaminyl-diphospho-decaprenol L-rhamnosyltransferase